MDGETHYYGCEEEHKECGEARFLREVERRAGATKTEMLELMEEIPSNAGRYTLRLEAWLRKILSSAP